MTAQDLKNSILQLAMQGKLVEQRAEEGTAKELIKNSKFYGKGKEIKDDEKPYDIPDSWCWVRLVDIGDIVGGGTPRTSEASFWENGDIPWLTPADMCGLGKYVSCGERKITQAGLKNSSARLMPKGTVIYSSRAPIGYIGIALNDLCTNQGFKSLVLFNIELSEYLYYCLISRTQNIISRASGTTFKEISGNEFGQTVVPIPPLQEQKRIVSKIEELLPYIEKYDRVYSKLEVINRQFSKDMQKSILQYAMQGKLVEQKPEEGTGEKLYCQIQTAKKKLIQAGAVKKEKPLPDVSEKEKPFDIPTSWKWVRLGEIILFQGGYAFKSDTYIEKSDNQVVRLGNVKNNKLLIHEKEVFISDELAEQVAAYMLHENDILVSMTGTRRKKDYFFTALVGKNDVSERKLYLNQRVGCFRTIDGICHKYLLYALQNDIIKNIIFTKETGTANQGNLGSEDIKQFVYIPLPPYEEQKRIVEELEKILPYCQCLDQ
ncbi:MAG: restriction endonuclease subunit S [Lachnospiraceae bacterium]|nr:restriction endonuclease subunit S [Lachnospiraceae bacterium]